MKKLIIKDLIQAIKRSFLFKIAVFLLILGILDFSFGSLLKKYYFRQYSGYLARTNYSINETTADVLIFGASTANHQYYPDVFEKRLNLSYYNVGRDGTSILYHYALLNAILKRYTPKMIIIDLRRELAVKPDGYDRLSMLLPYYEKYPEMEEIIKLRGPYEYLKMVSKTYPYNSLLFAILAGNTDYFQDRNKDIKGYLPLTRVWDEPIETITVPILNELDTTKIKKFESFIKTCIDSKIRLYIVISPNYFKMEYTDAADKKAGEIAQKYKVNFFDYSQDSLFLANANYFADIHHLNNNGAIVFSNKIVDRIIEAEANLTPE